MANNYILMSSVVELETPEEAKEFGDLLREEKELPDGEWESTEATVDVYDTTVWIRSEESVDFEVLTDRLIRWAKAHPQSSFVLPYAMTCSRMRAGEFGGGAIAVAGGKVKHVSAEMTAERWRNAQHQRWAAKNRAKAAG